MPEIRNPNHGGGGGQDNRSFLIMMIVMIGIIFGIQYWHAQHNPQTAAPNRNGAAAQPAAAPGSANTPAAPGAPANSASPAAAHSAAKSATAAAPATPAIQAATATTTVVENELYRITFSNRGGEVTSWILKKYTDSEGHPLDLVHSGAARLFGYPLSLYTYDANLNKQLDNALYVPSATGHLASPATLSFKYSADGVTVNKTFTFGAGYVIHADSVVTRNGEPIRALLTWPAAFGDQDSVTDYAEATVDTNDDGHTDHISYKKVGGGATLNGPYDFAGVSDEYFAAVFLPDQPQDATMVTLHDQIDVSKVKRNERNGTTVPTHKSTMVPVLGAGVGSLTGHNSERLFVGPKALDVLKSVHPAAGGSLEPILDFGFFGFIGKYLFLGLHAVHSWLPQTGAANSNYSWGWAIIIFTILIYAVLMPLRVQGMRAAVKMQRIQPQIDAIKAKYKHPKATDPRMGEMNAEIMAYQKTQGVSMFGGCIPSLVQLPLLFAFFTMMTRVVELRQAHFFWLPDLSLADPWHILPITMVATSFLVQFYTPSPGIDPKQQRMMAFFMPVISGYWTWTYASGLALYWNVGNVVMIVQQLIMNKTALGQEMRDIAAKRARRKADMPKPGKTAVARAGAAKTIQGKR